jgi:sRNA-binding carbon storage regulator CsrA
VLSISRSAVKLGFSAPPQINIRRQEINPVAKRPPRSEGKPLPALLVCH